ncbi:MAG: acyltransferase family protein [Bryobacteraceae bacterium]|jgi:peptidoglycan/LPS O-acetylase OafA/YrhL
MERADPPHPSRSWARLDGVDVLRGVAIFFVLMNHVNMRLRSVRVPYTNGLPEQLVDSLVWNGQCGVQISFAVSGLLITSTALRRWGSLSRNSIRDFYLLRFARIAPLLAALLAILSFLDLAQVEYFIVPAKAGGERGVGPGPRRIARQGTGRRRAVRGGAGGRRDRCRNPLPETIA